MNKCEFCEEDLNWCTCPKDCDDGFHQWSQSCEKCVRCNITKEEYLSNLH